MLMGHGSQLYSTIYKLGNWGYIDTMTFLFSLCKFKIERVTCYQPDSYYVLPVFFSKKENERVMV